MVIKTAGDDVDYTDTLKRYFGQKGWNVGMVCFIVNLYVAILIFFQLMAQNLYPVLLFVIEIFTGNNREITIQPDWTQFSYTWTCVIIFVLVSAMTAVRDLQIFVKINSYGVIFIFLIILFVCSVGIYGFAGTNYTVSQTTFDLYEQQKEAGESPSYLALIYLVNSHFARLMGILGGGFYFHNISLPVIKNAANKENTVRDVFIGYTLVFITYVLAGVLGYYGFVGKTFQSLDPSVNLIE
jgi:hypothetical protein